MLEKLSKYREKIIEELERTEKGLIKRPYPLSKKIFSSITQSIKEGKTIRGSLILLILELRGKKINRDHLKIALAIEFTHTALLIHDDIMDHDDLRRGRKSMHKEYEKMGKEIKSSDPSDFGISMGICVGDISIFISQLLLSEARDIDTKIKEKINNLISEEFLRVGFGQIQDLVFSHTKEMPRKEEVLEMYKNKTARYTFSMPMIVASLLNEESDVFIKEISGIGENIGTIFQITDDKLTINGKKKEVGKSIGNDISENKKTLYNISLRLKANKEDLKNIENIFGNKKIKNSEIKKIQDLIKKYKIEEEVNEEIEKNKKKIKQHLKEKEMDKSLKDFINELLNYIINRKKWSKP